MIVRDLLIKLGFRSDTSQLDKTDQKLAGIKSSVGALDVAAGAMLSNLAMQGVGKVIGTLKEGVDQSVQFGREMANISSILGGGQDRVKELASGVERLSLAYGVSTSDINDALYDLIGTLGDSAEATDQLELAMKLGRAGAATTKDGLRVLTAVTKAYGDTSMATMKKVADLASNTVELGVITMPELASSIGIATPLAATLGISIEELMANTATLTGVTGTGSEVMHQFTSAMRSVVDRSKPMDAAFKKAFSEEKFKSISEAIKKYGMIGTLQRLVATTDGSIESVNGLFGRIEGLNEALAITGKLSGNFVEKQDSMNTISGKVDTQLEKQTTGLGKAGFEMDKAKARSDALSRQIGERMTPAFLKFEETLGTIKLLFVDYILPLFSQVTSTAGDSASGVDLLSLSFRGLAVVLGAVMGILDTMFTTIVQVGKALAGLAAAVAHVATGNFAAAGATLRQTGAEFVAGERAYAGRITGYGDIMGRALFDVPKAQGMAEAAATAGPAGAPAINTDVGGISITVNAAPGTEAAAVSRELDTVARGLWDQNLMQAQAALAGDY